MINFLKSLPLVVKIIAGILVIVGLFFLFGQIQSCNYDRGRKEYEAEKKTWEAERSKLIADADAKEAKVAELETKVMAYQAAADAGKKVDDSLAQKIEKLGEDAKHEEEMASVPVGCNTRGARVCDLLRANNIPADCAAIIRESCSR